MAGTEAQADTGVTVQYRMDGQLIGSRGKQNETKWFELQFIITASLRLARTCSMPYAEAIRDYVAVGPNHQHEQNQNNDNRKQRG